jgi:cytochrome c oxidase subunit 2
MKASMMGMRRLAAGVAAAILGVAFSGYALAEDLIGQPTPGAIGLQPGVTELRHSAAYFHDIILMPIITVICLFVAGLLLWCIFRFNKKSNPVPAKWSHNTPIEIIWTIVPVLILMVIAIFSFRLLFAYNDMPKPDLTVKATGYQWYWGYEYPDQKIAEITSNVLPEEQAKAANVPYRLASDAPMVVPVGKVVRVLVTGADVIHGFAIPAFGIMVDAIPGRVNETWFKVERIGTYYGQCRQLCGIDHAFMPIEVKVVSQADFAAWVAAKTAPSAPAAAPATAAAAPAAAPAATPTAAPAAAKAAPAAALKTTSVSPSVKLAMLTVR